VTNGNNVLYITGTESQNHRQVEVGRDVWRTSGPSLLLEQGHLEPVPQDLVQMALNTFKDRDSTTFLGNLCQCFVNLTVNKALPDVQREPPIFHFVPIASGPVTRHH